MFTIRDLMVMQKEQQDALQDASCPVWESKPTSRKLEAALLWLRRQHVNEGLAVEADSEWQAWIGGHSSETGSCLILQSDGPPVQCKCTQVGGG